MVNCPTFQVPLTWLYLQAKEELIKEIPEFAFLMLPFLLPTVFKVSFEKQHFQVRQQITENEIREDFC